MRKVFAIDIIKKKRYNLIFVILRLFISGGLELWHVRRNYPVYDYQSWCQNAYGTYLLLPLWKYISDAPSAGHCPGSPRGSGYTVARTCVGSWGCAHFANSLSHALLILECDRLRKSMARRSLATIGVIYRHNTV